MMIGSTVFLFSFIGIFGAQNWVHSLEDCPKGVIKPQLQFSYFEEYINLTCIVNGSALEKSSLHFRASKVDASGDRILRHTYTKHLPAGQTGISISDYLNKTRTKRARYVQYVCMYTEKCTIDHVYVKVDYKPKPVKDGNCVVYNWENMTCRWDLIHEYRQLKDETTSIKLKYAEQLNVSLKYSITTEKWSKCPHLEINGRILTCKFRSNDPQDGLRMGHYFFHLTINNTKTLHSAQTHASFDVLKLVKPSKVENLSARGNRTWISLSWNVKKIYRMQKFKIEYHREGDRLSDWKEINTSVANIKLSNLKPFSSYTIKVSAIPLVDGKAAGYWSDIAEVDAWTLEDVPSENPQLLPGYYSCLEKNCSKVKIYWKPISQEHRNGRIVKYRIKVENNNKTTEHILNNPSATNYIFSIPNAKYSTKVFLSQATAVGFPIKFDSYLTIPALNGSPPFPKDFTVEAINETLVNATWYAANQSGKSRYSEQIVTYTIVWCLGNADGCQGAITYKIDVFDKNVTKYWSVIPLEQSFKHYAFGISSEAVTKRGRFISSGIAWNKCSYLKNGVPSKPPTILPNLEGNTKHSMLFTWKGYTCMKDAVGPVINYIIKYCPVDSVNRCTGNETVEQISSNANSYEMKGLLKDQKYKISLAANFTGGISPTDNFTFLSQPAINTIFNGTIVKLYNGTINESEGLPIEVFAGIGALLGVIVIICVVVIIWRVRHYLNEQEVEIVVPAIRTNGNAIHHDLEDSPLLTEGKSITSNDKAYSVEGLTKTQSNIIQMFKNPNYVESSGSGNPVNSVTLNGVAHNDIQNKTEKVQNNLKDSTVQIRNPNEVKSNESGNHASPVPMSSDDHAKEDVSGHTSVALHVPESVTDSPSVAPYTSGPDVVTSSTGSFPALSSVVSSSVAPYACGPDVVTSSAGSFPALSSVVSSSVAPYTCGPDVVTSSAGSFPALSSVVSSSVAPYTSGSDVVTSSSGSFPALSSVVSSTVDPYVQQAVDHSDIDIPFESSDQGHSSCNDLSELADAYVQQGIDSIQNNVINDFTPDTSGFDSCANKPLSSINSVHSNSSSGPLISASCDPSNAPAACNDKEFTCDSNGYVYNE